MSLRFTLSFAIAIGCCVSASSGHEPVSVVLTYELDSCEGPIKPDKQRLLKLIEPLKRRIGDVGDSRVVNDKTIQVELYGNIDAAKLDEIKDRITSGGCLEFRILADSDQTADIPIINQAKQEPPTKKDVTLGAKKVAEWIPYKEVEFGPVDKQRGGMVKRLAGKVAEALLLKDDINVTGEFLLMVKKGLDTSGHPAIHFRLNEEGGRKLRDLTSQNLPKPSTPETYRHLGIVFNKQLLSAPVIRSAIADEGMISGGSLTEHELDGIIDSLTRGSLPRMIRLVSEKHVAPAK